MAHLLVEFAEPVSNEDGKNYVARACGDEMPDGMWQGWIEFVPIGGGEPGRSGRETTQPNRVDKKYWATCLKPVLLQGCPSRRSNRYASLTRLFRTADLQHAGRTGRTARPPRRHPGRSRSTGRARRSCADGYRPMSGWHLVNIVRRIASDADQLLQARAALGRGAIISAVRADAGLAR